MSIMWNGLDRRKFPRAKYKCTIKIKRPHLLPKITSTYTENIGIGGICVVLNEDLRVFRNVLLEIYLKNGKDPVDCSGSVVWVVQEKPAKGKLTYDTGIEFIDLKELDKERIGVVVEKALREDGPA